jgi:hypothetical protein
VQTLLTTVILPTSAKRQKMVCMSMLRKLIVGDAFELRAPTFWRDLCLGMFWGIALVWASFDALQWRAFIHNVPKEVAFVAIPLAIAMVSPRRLAVLLVGMGLPLFRLLFLAFAFQSVKWAIAVAIWALGLVLVAKAVNENYDDISVPDGTTGIELLLSMSALAMSIFALWEFRRVIGLNS